MQAGMWLCFKDYETYGRVSRTVQNRVAFEDHATSGRVFEIASNFKLTTLLRQALLQAQINIIGFHQGSPARQKQSNHGDRLGGEVGYPEQQIGRAHV